MRGYVFQGFMYLDHLGRQGILIFLLRVRELLKFKSHIHVHTVIKLVHL